MQSLSRWKTIHSHRNCGINLVFSWVFGSANSVTRPDRRNAKMVYTTKSGFWGKVSFIQRHLRTLLNSFNSYNFWHFLRVVQIIVDPKYISFKTAPGITIWQSHGEIQVWSVISVTVISVTFPSISYVIYALYFKGSLTSIVCLLCDLYGKKLFPIISAPNIFTRSRDVKQWNKTFENEKIKFENMEKESWN